MFLFLFSFFKDVIWQGKIAGVDEAVETFKAEKAYPMHKLREVSGIYICLNATFLLKSLDLN